MAATANSPTSPATATATATAAKPQLVAVDTEVQPAKAPPFEIQSNANATRWLKALVYAEYGVGKTYLMGTAAEIPEMRDVLFISAEAGTLTIFDPTSPHEFKWIDIVDVNTFTALRHVHDYLKVHCSLRDRASHGGDQPALDRLRSLQNQLLPRVTDPERLRLYRTVVIDSLYEIESYCMYQLLGVTSATAIDEEVNKEQWDEIGQQRRMIHRMIRNFRNLPMNILFTCPRMFREDKKLNTRKYMPMMTGKLASEVQGFVDLVGHYVSADQKIDEADIGEEVPDFDIPRRMYIQPGPRYAAKSRFSQYKKAYMDNPSMLSIVQNVGLLDTWRDPSNPMLPQQSTNSPPPILDKSQDESQKTETQS